MWITETQKYKFTGPHSNTRYRWIPLDKIDRIDNVEVSEPNLILKAKTGRENNQLWIRWTQPLPLRGEHTFIIRYRVVGGLRLGYKIEPQRFADDWWVCNGLILFDEMTTQNAPTRVIPGSHRWPTVNVAAVNHADWTPPDLSPEDQRLISENLDAPPNEVIVQAPAGSAVIINSALWHSGTRNATGARRRALHLSYTRRDLPQQLYQRDFLTRELYERLNPEQRFLLDVEPLPDRSAETGRMPKRQGAGWWN